jgi:hypothetical protein
MDIISIAAAKIACSNNDPEGSNQNRSQNTLYKFSFDELKDQKVPNPTLDIIKQTMTKTTISQKGGVPCEIFAVDWNIRLWLGEVNLQSKELTKYFDVPIKTERVEGAVSNASITNMVAFSPLLIMPTIQLGPMTIKQACLYIADYITYYDYDLASTSMQHNEYKKTVGTRLKVIFEFANETIRDAFYNEFSGMLNEISHFCLMYQDSDTIDCKYIGG